MKLHRRKPDKPEGRRRSQLNAGQNPGAFSYYAQRSTTRNNTGREAGRETTAPPTVLKSLLERGGLLIFIVVIAAGSINSLSLTTDPRIVPLTSQGGIFLHDTATYASSTNDILGSTIWNRNKITINTRAVSNQLKSKYPELAEVSITLPLLAHRPVVYIQPTKPVLILSSGGTSYVVGKNGLALLQTNQLPANSRLELPVVDDQTGVKLQTGKQALTRDNVAFIEMVLKQLEAAGIPVAHMALPPGTSEVDVYIKNQPYYGKFSMHASLAEAKQQAGTFIAVQHKLQSKHINPSYIDVRVLGRAYYK
jgi:hypothetical protein